MSRRDPPDQRARRWPSTSSTPSTRFWRSPWSRTRKRRNTYAPPRRERLRLSGCYGTCVCRYRVDEAFFDPFIRWLDAEFVDGEERERVVGMTSDWQVLIVVHVERKQAIRLISARPATREERLQYEDY